MMSGMEIGSDDSEERRDWWLWRMSDRTLLPIHTDEEGVDWPFLGDARARALDVDHLLRYGAPVRTERPNLRPGFLGAASIGWGPAIAFAVCMVLRFAPGLPDAARVVGGLGWLLIPAGIAAVVGYRRVRSLPADLQDVAREEVRDASTRIRVRPWIAWTALIVLGLLLALLGVSANG